MPPPEISLDHLNLTTEDLIDPQDVVVTLSHSGYASTAGVRYQGTARGSRQERDRDQDEDFIETLFVAHTNDTTAVLLESLARSNGGACSKCPGRARVRGKPMVNFCHWARARRSPRCCRSSSRRRAFVFMATRRGTVKRRRVRVLGPSHLRHHRGGSARRRSARRRGREDGRVR